jgi:transposase InsO family protein
MNVDERDSLATQFGVAAEQVERDHLISHLLAFLSRRFGDRIHFIGGTALARTHLPDGRLSEDIDLIALGDRKQVAQDEELDRVAAQRRSYPTVLRCDNGPELACSAMADWADGHVGLHVIPPSEPWRNGYVESFKSRIRDECLNIHSYWSLAQARVVIGDRKHDYNHRRRHSSLGYLPPAQYTARRAHVGGDGE